MMQIFGHAPKNVQVATAFSLAGIRRVKDLRVLLGESNGFDRIRQEIIELSEHGMSAIYTIRWADLDDASGLTDMPPLRDDDVFKAAKEFLTGVVSEALSRRVPLLLQPTNEPAGGPGRIESPKALDRWVEFANMIYEVVEAHRNPNTRNLIGGAGPALATWRPLSGDQYHPDSVMGRWRKTVQKELVDVAMDRVDAWDVHLHTADAMEAVEEAARIRSVVGDDNPPIISTECGIAKHKPEAVNLEVEFWRLMMLCEWQGYKLVCYAPMHPGNSETYRWSYACESPRAGDDGITMNEPFARWLGAAATGFNEEARHPKGASTNSSSS